MVRRSLLVILALGLDVVPALAETQGGSETAAIDRFGTNAFIGALFIGLYTYGRFNTPATIRSSTTRLRYYIGVSTYVVAVLALYGLVVNTKALAEFVLDHSGLGKIADPSTFPLLLALVMTSSVEAISPLSKLDEFFRQRFHRLASIPHRARLLSDDLRAAPLKPPDALRSRIESELQDGGFAPDDVVFDDLPSPRQHWTRLTLFLCHLRSWRGSESFGAFYIANAGDIVTIERRYQELIRQAHVLFSATRRNSSAVPIDWSPLVDSHRTAFLWQVETLMEAVCDVVSRGILECGRTEKVRDRELEAVGLTVSHEGLTMDQRIAVLLMIFGMLTLFIVASNSDRPLDERIALALGATISNWVAVLWAIEPRERRWPIAQPDRPDFRPVRYYVVAALGAGVSGLMIRAFSRMVMYGSLGGAIANANQWAGWAMVDVATAFLIAFNIDNRPRPGLRWLEAALQGAGSAAVVWLIWRLGAAFVVTSLPWLIMRVGLFGFVLGFFVPFWYRGAPHRPAIAIRTSPRLVGPRANDAAA